MAALLSEMITTTEHGSCFTDLAGLESCILQGSAAFHEDMHYLLLA